jgi:hypothetical protein
VPWGNESDSGQRSELARLSSRQGYLFIILSSSYQWVYYRPSIGRIGVRHLRPRCTAPSRLFMWCWRRGRHGTPLWPARKRWPFWLGITPAGETLAAETYHPNTVERLSWFLAANQARLLQDLLVVVDLRNINHENICCLNTAVIIAIFAHRRHQLSALLDELRQMNDEEKESKRRANHAAKQDDVVDRAFVQAMRHMDLDQQQQREAHPYVRRTPQTATIHSHQGRRLKVAIVSSGSSNNSNSSSKTSNRLAIALMLCATFARYCVFGRNNAHTVGAID